MVTGWTKKKKRKEILGCIKGGESKQFCLLGGSPIESLLTALEAAMAAVSGPRSLPPFNSPPSLLLSSSSVTDTAPGPFFFFNLAKIDDSLSGKGGISSRTVA